MSEPLKQQDVKNQDEIDTAPLEPVDPNTDPISGSPGSHPVGTGVGAVGGGAAGAAVGTAVGGPVGGIIGGTIGAIAGGLGGKAAAEAIDPTVESAYWREEHVRRPYVQSDDDWETYEPAFRHGWESRARHYDDRWDDVEDRIEAKWEETRSDADLHWDRAKHATRDAWDRLSSWFDPDEEDRYWEEHYSNRPYVRDGEGYDLYAPAYRLGYESKRRHVDSRWQDVEDRMEREWRQLKASSRLRWENAKRAVRDGWHRVEEMMPGDFDNDGR